MMENRGKELLVMKIISVLDEIARDYNSYEYGLPIGYEQKEELLMQQAVLKLLEEYEP